MSARLRRVALLIGLAAVAVGAAALVSGGQRGYTVRATFRNAGGLRKGFLVRVDGAPVGKITSLELDHRDRVVAQLRVDDTAAPVGAGARATVRAADLLGEKFVDLQRGDMRHPLPSGGMIPPTQTADSVELDDVLNTLDMPTRDALRVFLGEQGAALVGRGRDLGALLQALPTSLDRSGRLLAQFAQDNRALGRLVSESDRVVAAIAPQRSSLGRLVSGAATTFETLRKRRGQLGETVRRAPATLASLRRALAALEGAAIPLSPAARGLRATAPQLTATLDALPGFAADARPTLATVQAVAPVLATLGRRATPVVRRVHPLATELSAFALAFSPVTRTLDKGFPDFLGLMEGWARATQSRDAASHVFRFGVTSNPSGAGGGLQTFMANFIRRRERSRTAAAKRPADRHRPRPTAAVPTQGSHRAAGPGLPRGVAPTTPGLGPKTPPPIRAQNVEPLLNYLLGP